MLIGIRSVVPGGMLKRALPKLLANAIIQYRVGSPYYLYDKVSM